MHKAMLVGLTASVLSVVGDLKRPTTLAGVATAGMGSRRRRELGHGDGHDVGAGLASDS